MFLKSIIFKENVEFESKRKSQKKLFKVKTTTSYHKNYRKSYVDHETGEEIIPEEKLVEKKFVIFEKGLQIDFKQVTVIVGDNGCGKTSLVKNIAFPHEEYNGFSFENDHKENVVKNWINNKKRSLHFGKQPENIIVENNVHKNSHISNFKKHNLKNGEVINPQSLLDSWDMETFSNGESNLDFLNSLLTISNSLIVLDEPETSLSIKSQCRILKVLKKMSKTNQIIIITHSEILMKLANEVYDFETKKYVGTNEYITQQKK